MTADQAFSFQYHISQHPQLGSLFAASSRHGLVYFSFGCPKEHNLAAVWRACRKSPPHPELTHAPAGLPSQALLQVHEYLAGNRRHFTFAIDWSIFTAFQAAVYRAVIDIPYGTTRSYAQVAAAIGRPKAARAVGSANAANPLPIIIPCHRLVGSDGSLRGYGGTGGTKTKQWLLDLEKQAFLK